MASPRSRQAARLRARRRRAQQRARIFVALGLVGVVALVTLLVTAFDVGGGSSSSVVPPSSGSLPERPSREPLATVGNLRIELPVAPAATTAIGFRAASDGSLALQPVGRQANEGLLARLWRGIAGVPKDGPSWYQLGGEPGTEVAVVGAAPGTDLYAPVEGSVVGIADITMDGRQVGSRVDIRPVQAPSVIVAVSYVAVDPAIAVGTRVIPASSRLGTVANVAAVERQSLAEHTADDGNNVAIASYASAGSLP